MGFGVRYHAVDHEIACSCKTPCDSHHCETCTRVFSSKDEFNEHACPIKLQESTIFNEQEVPECTFMDVSEADDIEREHAQNKASKGGGCRCFLMAVLTLALVGLCVVSAGLILKFKSKSRAMAEVYVVNPSVTDARTTAIRRLLAEGQRITAEDVLSWYPQYEELN